MPLSDRDYMKDEHPPFCTCRDCVEKRNLERQLDASGISHAKYPHYEYRRGDISGELREYSIIQAYFCLKCNKYVNIKKIYKPFKFGVQGVKCKICDSQNVELREWKL